MTNNEKQAAKQAAKQVVNQVGNQEAENQAAVENQETVEFQEPELDGQAAANQQDEVQGPDTTETNSEILNKLKVKVSYSSFVKTKKQNLAAITSFIFNAYIEIALNLSQNRESLGGKQWNNDTATQLFESWIKIEGMAYKVLGNAHIKKHLNNKEFTN